MTANNCNTPRIAVIGADPLALERLVALDGRLTPDSFVSDFETEPERLEHCAGLLLADAQHDVESARVASDLTRRFLCLGRPVLAFGIGARILNDSLDGREFASTAESPDRDIDESRSRNTVFLTVGSKTAMTIGGSGWVTIRDVALHPIPLGYLSDRVMPVALTESSEAVAFEEPGRKWTIGVTWDLTQVDRLPSGFGNILEAFVDRTVG